MKHYMHEGQSDSRLHSTFLTQKSVRAKVIHMGRDLPVELSRVRSFTNEIRVETHRSAW